MQPIHLLLYGWISCVHTGATLSQKGNRSLFVLLKYAEIFSLALCMIHSVGKEAFVRPCFLKLFKYTSWNGGRVPLFPHLLFLLPPLRTLRVFPLSISVSLPSSFLPFLPLSRSLSLSLSHLSFFPCSVSLLQGDENQSYHKQGSPR